MLGTNHQWMLYFKISVLPFWGKTLQSIKDPGEMCFNIFFTGYSLWENICHLYVLLIQFTQPDTILVSKTINGIPSNLPTK